MMTLEELLVGDVEPIGSLRVARDIARGLRREGCAVITPEAIVSKAFVEKGPRAEAKVRDALVRSGIYRKAA